MRWLFCTSILWLASLCFGSCLSADLNNDGVVDFQDCAVLLSQWMQRCDVSNNYLRFNGTTGYVTVPSNAALNLGTGDASITQWLNGKSDYVTLVSKLAGDVGYYISFANYITAVFTTGNPSNEWNYYIPLSGILDGSWHNLAVVKGVDGILFYIDAVNIPETILRKTGSPNSDTSSPLVIISDGYTGSGLPVLVDDLRIYKGVALSQNQVTAIFAGGAGKKYVLNETPAASAAWNMDEGSGTTTTDTQSGLVGTFHGGVTWGLNGGVPFDLGGGGGGVAAWDEDLW